MAYLDYSLPDVGMDYSKSLSELGDALTDVMKRRQQQRQFDAQMEFQREQEQRKFDQAKMNYDYQNRIIAQREMRDQRADRDRQNQVAAAAAERARKAQSPQEAAAILGQVHMYDPETGKETGRGQLVPGPLPSVGPEPLMPMKPEAPSFPAPPEIAARQRGKARAADISLENPADMATSDPEAVARMRATVAGEPAMQEQRKGKLFVDQINDDGIATLIDDQGEKLHVRAGKDWQEGTLIGPDGQVTSMPQAEGSTRRFEPEVKGASFEDTAEAYSNYDREKAQYEQDMASFPQRQAEYKAAAAKAEGARPYTIKFGPDDPGIPFDFQTQRTAGRVQAAQDFVDTVGAMPLTPQQQEAAKFARIAILNGADPNKVMKQFQDERILGIKQDYGIGLQAQKDAAALERAKIPKPGFNLQVSRLGLDERKEQSKNLRSDLKTFAERYGAKTIQEDVLQIPRIEKDLASGQAQRQRNAMVQLWQMAQHDHRFSDKDAVMAQTVDPSYLAQIENWISLKSTGSLDADVQRTAIDTARSFGSYLADKSAQMRNMAKQDFIDSNLYDQHEADVLLSQQIPGWARVTESAPARRGGPPEVNARNKGKGKATTVTKTRAVDPLDEAMQ